MANEWLSEQIKTIRNLADVGLIIHSLGKEDLLPTILELMKIEIDQVVEEHCIKEADSGD